MNTQNKKILGKCCKNKSSYSALYNNEPLENFWLLLCEEHAFSKIFEKNVIKLERIEAKNGKK